MWLFEVAVELWSETESPVSCGFFQLVWYFNSEKSFLGRELFSFLCYTAEEATS